jgi:hypothetical protein
MNSKRYARATALFALVLSGCDGREVIGPSPTPLSPTPPPPSVPALSGDLALRSISPEAGAMVLARPCAEGATRFCADQLELSVEVVVDRDLEGVSLTVRFGGCGVASSPPFSLAPHTPAVVNLARVDLSDDGPMHDGVGAELLCELPAVTRHVIVNLWRTGEPRAPLLTRDFALEYTFARP